LDESLSFSTEDNRGCLVGGNLNKKQNLEICNGKHNAAKCKSKPQAECNDYVLILNQ
jgi:hypothetical protein